MDPCKTVAEIWADFDKKCLPGFMPEEVVIFKHAFYAAFESALLSMVCAPHIFAGDADKTSAYMVGLVNECKDYFNSMMEARNGSKSE